MAIGLLAIVREGVVLIPVGVALSWFHFLRLADENFTKFRAPNKVNASLKGFARIPVFAKHPADYLFIQDHRMVAADSTIEGLGFRVVS